jgi:hypothetical protein
VLIVIAGTFIAGLGFMVALEIFMWILTIVSIVTVIQRMNFVLKQTKSS